MSFAELARRAGQLAIKNSPTILTSIGVVGTVTTAYLASKATFRIAQDITLEEAIQERILTPKERIEFVHKNGLWKHYIPAAGMGVATITCIIGANHVGSRRAAGLAAAYTITEKTFEEYKAKVVEKFGERKEEAVHAEIAQDHMDELDSVAFENIEFTGLSEGLPCHDMFGNQYFRGSVEGIRSAVNEFNSLLLHEGFASLSDFYGMLDIDAPAYSQNIGWNSDRLVDIRIMSGLIHETIPCIAFNFKNEPLPDYGRFRRF